MCWNREVWDGPHETTILVLGYELSIVIYDLFNCSEISDVHCALMNPEVFRLDISVDVASGVHLSQRFQQFGGDLCHDSVDILFIGNSITNILLQWLFKVLYDKVPSPILLSMFIVFGEARELSYVVLLFEFLEEKALLEHAGVACIVGVELDSAHLLRILLLILAYGPLTAWGEHFDEGILTKWESLRDIFLFEDLLKHLILLIISWISHLC